MSGQLQPFFSPVAGRLTALNLIGTAGEFLDRLSCTFPSYWNFPLELGSARVCEWVQCSRSVRLNRFGSAGKAATGKSYSGTLHRRLAACNDLKDSRWPISMLNFAQFPRGPANADYVAPRHLERHRALAVDQPKYRGDALVGVTPALEGMEARDSRSIFLFRCARVEFTPSKPSNGGIRHFGVRLICIRSC